MGVVMYLSPPSQKTVTTAPFANSRATLEAAT